MEPLSYQLLADGPREAVIGEDRPLPTMFE